MSDKLNAESELRREGGLDGFAKFQKVNIGNAQRVRGFGSATASNPAVPFVKPEGIADSSIVWNELTDESFARHLFSKYLDGLVLFTDVGTYLFTGVYCQLQADNIELMRVFYRFHTHYKSAYAFHVEDHPDYTRAEQKSILSKVNILLELFRE